MAGRRRLRKLKVIMKHIAFKIYSGGTQVQGETVQPYPLFSKEWFSDKMSLICKQVYVPAYNTLMQLAFKIRGYRVQGLSQVSDSE